MRGLWWVLWAALEARAQGPVLPPDAGTPSPVVALRLRAVGDVMLGTAEPEGHLPPDGGEGLLEAVAPLLRDADLTFANLEGPFCDTGASTKCGRRGHCYAFRTPTAYGLHLADAGVDLASTANNHAGDHGEPCRRQTEAMLDALGIAWSGPPGTLGLARLPAAEGRPDGGLTVALAAFHTGGGVNDVRDIPAAQALVRRARTQAHLVVVSFHGGGEGPRASRVPPGVERYLGENRGDVRRFAHAVIDAGAHLVLGHGPHVLRGMEVYRGHLIAYSLGNFATYGRFALSGALGVSAILEVSLGPDGRLVRGRVLPTVQVGRGVPLPDTSGRALGLLRTLSAQDFPRTAPRLLDDGLLLP